MLEISERFVAQCSPVIGTNLDTCGSVTRASVAHLTPSELNDLFTPGGLFADLDAWFIHSIEMAACGTKRNGLYDWIMANADRSRFKSALQPTKVVGSPSLLQPFIFGKQETIINKDHWKLSGGYALSAYTPVTTGPLSTAQKALGTTGDRILRVTSRYGIPTDAGWFLDRDIITIFNRSGGGITQSGNWKVLASAANDSLTAVDVLVRPQNAASDEPWDATPTTGVIIAGINNVNDYESWCANRPTIDPRKRVPFWFQTWRNTRCVDSEYQAVYARLMESNRAFQEFGDLPLAERNRQDEVEAQRRFVNSFFFQKPISVNQTLELWQNLDDIETPSGEILDPGMSGKLIGKRANFIGVMEQLRRCDRIKDLSNNNLNFYEFLNINYALKRSRESSSNGSMRQVTDIDWWTDSAFRARMMTAFLSYYETEYQGMVRINVDADQWNQKLGIMYDSYRVKRPGGIRINIMSSDYFDDFLDQMEDVSLGSAGRRLWALDIGKPGAGTIYYAQLATNRKSYSTAKIEELARLDATYRCVMSTLSQEQTLYSETGMPIVECPLSSLVINGIADADPDMEGVSGTGADAENLY